MKPLKQKKIEPVWGVNLKKMSLSPNLSNFENVFDSCYMLISILSACVQVSVYTHTLFVSI